MVTNPNLSENTGCFGFVLKIFGFSKKTHLPEKRRSEVASGNPGLLASWKQAEDQLKPKPLPYRMRDDFLSPAELSFYHVLKYMTGTVVVALTKVNLADIFYVTRPHENASYFNKINRKHVDFLMCDAKTMRPILGIELDDRSHLKEDRIRRDALVDQVFQTAGLPLAHVPAAMSYNTTQLSKIFRDAVQQDQTAKRVLAEKEVQPYKVPVNVGEAPFCPKCGEQMVLREAKRGSHRGDVFYGCVNYPKCREMIPLPAIDKLSEHHEAGGSLAE